jgi:16S rRNA processing protein RimM
MIAPQQHIAIGKISGVFGLQGWVKVRSYTDPREGILQYSPWLLGREDGWVAVALAGGRPHGRGIIARLAGCQGPDDARRLVGCEVAVTRAQLPEPAEDDYYWADLVGLDVRTTAGQRLGRVERLLETGANDVLVVKGERERLIPFVVTSVVVEVDLDQRLIVVDWDADD